MLQGAFKLFGFLLTNINSYRGLVSLRVCKHVSKCVSMFSTPLLNDPRVSVMMSDCLYGYGQMFIVLWQCTTPWNSGLFCSLDYILCYFGDREWWQETPQLNISCLKFGLLCTSILASRKRWGTEFLFLWLKTYSAVYTKVVFLKCFGNFHKPETCAEPLSTVCSIYATLGKEGSLPSFEMSNFINYQSVTSCCYQLGLFLSASAEADSTGK